MAGELRNVQPGQPVAVRFRDGSMHCMVKVANPTGRTRYKGKFVCNSACSLQLSDPRGDAGTAAADSEC